MTIQMKDLGKAVVETEYAVRGPIVAKAGDKGRVGVGLDGQDAAFAEGRDVLGAVEAEAAEIAIGAQFLAVQGGTGCLGAFR